MFFIASCDKSDIQKSDSKIALRDDCVDDCEDCPANDCCCAITLLSSPGIGGVDLVLCGTSGPCLSERECEVTDLDMCADILNSFELDINLPNQFSTGLFCVSKNTPFGITSAGPGTPTVRLTCQLGHTSPQSVTITLNSPPDKPFWQTDGNCELSNCF